MAKLKYAPCSYLIMYEGNSTALHKGIGFKLRKIPRAARQYSQLVLKLTYTDESTVTRKFSEVKIPFHNAHTSLGGFLV